MALDAHLVELTVRHSALEKKIEKERTRPSADALKLAEWKKQKLHLKDEMERLRGETSH